MAKNKLKFLKKSLRRWNGEAFRLVDLNIEKMVQEMNDMNKADFEEALDGGDRRRVLSKHLWLQLCTPDSLIHHK